jgi:hypothetical protein
MMFTVPGYGSTPNTSRKAALAQGTSVKSAALPNPVVILPFRISIGIRIFSPLILNGTVLAVAQNDDIFRSRLRV